MMGHRDDSGVCVGRTAGTIWTATSGPGIATALKALRQQYQVVRQPPAIVRRTWLDTADWRLYRAGAALAVRTGAGRDLLELTTPGDDLPLSVPAGPEIAAGRPQLTADLPADIAGKLASTLGLRAVLPVAATSLKITDGVVLDARGRTVARFERIAPPRQTAPGDAALAPLLVIWPERHPDAALVTSTLRRAGLTRVKRPVYHLALTAAGHDPDAVRAPAVLPGLPATTAVARVLLGFLDEMEASAGGTIADADTEFLHDFRVAVRRSRSAVKLLSGALPAPAATWAAPRLKWLGDLTTPVRDLDVHLLGLPATAARLHSARPADLEPLAAYLTTIRTAERRTLVHGLESPKFARFRSRWRAILEPLAEGTASGGQTAAEFGAVRLAEAHRRVLRPGSRITPGSPPEALHDLRKRGKELRYLLEIFSGLLLPAARPLVKELKGLQDVLGAFQDSEVQRLALTGLAESMLAERAAPAATLLAMGEISARLYDDQVHAREEFARWFGRFAAASPPSGHLI